MLKQRIWATISDQKSEWYRLHKQILAFQRVPLDGLLTYLGGSLSVLSKKPVKKLRGLLTRALYPRGCFLARHLTTRTLAESQDGDSGSQGEELSQRTKKRRAEESEATLTINRGLAAAVLPFNHTDSGLQARPIAPPPPPFFLFRISRALLPRFLF